MRGQGGKKEKSDEKSYSRCCSRAGDSGLYEKRAWLEVVGEEGGIADQYIGRLSTMNPH